MKNGLGYVLFFLLPLFLGSTESSQGMKNESNNSKEDGINASKQLSKKLEELGALKERSRILDDAWFCFWKKVQYAIALGCTEDYLYFVKCNTENILTEQEKIVCDQKSLYVEIEALSYISPNFLEEIKYSAKKWQYEKREIEAIEEFIRKWRDFVEKDLNLKNLKLEEFSKNTVLCSLIRGKLYETCEMFIQKKINIAEEVFGTHPEMRIDRFQMPWNWLMEKECDLRKDLAEVEIMVNKELDEYDCLLENEKKSENALNRVQNIIEYLSEYDYKLGNALHLVTKQRELLLKIRELKDSDGSVWVKNLQNTLLKHEDSVDAFAKNLWNMRQKVTQGQYDWTGKKKELEETVTRDNPIANKSILMEKLLQKKIKEKEERMQQQEKQDRIKRETEAKKEQMREIQSQDENNTKRTPDSVEQNENEDL